MAMLYEGPFGKSLTSEEFTRACVAAKVEVTITSVSESWGHIPRLQDSNN